MVPSLASSSSLPWKLLKTGQEEGLLPLRAPTPSVDRRAMLLRQACRLCGYPRRVTVATMEDGCVVGKAVSEVSPSVPGEQVLSHAAQKHAQGPEGPSPGVQRGAIRGRPRRNSSGRGTLAWQRPSTVRVLVMSSETAAHQSASPCMPCGHHPCAIGGTQSARSRRRPVSGSPGGSGLPCGAHHDRPLIVVALPRPWEEGRTKVLLPSESPDT